jgi:hypothetical protein
MEWIYIIIAAASGALFNLISVLAVRFVSSGKVTPDHLKKEDLNELKDAFNKHLDRHNECEKDFVQKGVFEKHLHDCPIKEVVDDLNRHKVSHGRMETKMDQRLGVIEKFATETNDLLRLYSDRLNDVNTNLQVMIQEVKDYHKGNGKS